MRNVGFFGFAIALLVGCGAADEHPLGGPYGGSGTAANTSKGDGTGASGTPGDDTSDGGTGDDGGTPGNDSGTQHDSGTAQDSGGNQTGPTWTQIFNGYLANSTQGRCPGCHSQMSTAAKSYTWLQGKGYINGANSVIVVPGRSDLSWFGGNMPPSGPTSWSQATSDMKAWVAAGAANN